VPTRRLVVALAVLMIGVFGVGVVAALSRTGDKAKPSAQPSPTASFATAPTTEPPVESPTPEPTVTPAVTPSASPSVSGNGNGGGGNGGGGNGGGGNGGGGNGGGAPDMPNTGGSPALAALALAAGATALGVRRAVHR
jgi:uncharacterized membrane protein YgcG